MSTARLIAPPPRRRLWLTVLAGLVLFAAGMVTGGVGSLWLAQRVMTLNREQPDRLVAMVATRLDRKLQLTPDQSVAVRRVLDARARNLRAIRDAAWPQAAEQLARLRDDVAKELDPRQAGMWQQRFARLEKRLPFAVPPAAAKTE